MGDVTQQIEAMRRWEDHHRSFHYYVNGQLTEEQLRFDVARIGYLVKLFKRSHKHDNK